MLQASRAYLRPVAPTTRLRARCTEDNFCTRHLARSSRWISGFLLLSKPYKRGADPGGCALIAAKSRANRFSFALLLLFFRAHGRFPRTQDEIEPATVADVARQLDIGLTSAQTLAGSGRTVERHRADIRTLFGFREASVADGETLTAWLRDHAVAETRDPALLAGALEQRCRDLAIEPPAPERIVRLVRAALHAYDERFCDDMHRRLPAANPDGSSTPGAGLLGFRRATPLDFYALHTWLVERALEHDKPTLLLQLACEKLYREKMVRPGVTRLERLVATARDQAHDETFRRLIPLLTDERKAFLDGLLTPDPQTGRTLLSWVRQEAVSHVASQIIATLKKIAFLHDTGVHQWDLDSLNPNRAKWLAQIGWKSTNQALQRMPPRGRYPVLVAFLQQALLHHTDVAVELFDQCLWGCHSEAKHELEEFRKAMARSTNDKLKLFRELGHVLLDDAIEDPDVRAVSFERVPKKVLQEAIEETQSLIRPRPDDAIDFLGKRYSYLRQFVPLFLQTLTLRAQGPNDTVLRAVEVIRDLDRVPTRRPVPKDAPMALVTDAWRPYIREPDGRSAGATMNSARCGTYGRITIRQRLGRTQSAIC